MTTDTEALRELLAAAYVAGATDVHNHWVDGHIEGEPDFGEAAFDYAHSVECPRLAQADALADALREIAKDYENQDFSHLEFRVFAKRICDEALAAWEMGK